MKKLLFLLIMVSFLSTFSQKDTLRLYYSGLAVKLLDSNEVKIGKWANTLKGKHVDVEIHAYYDKGEFKQYAEQRLADVELVVIRKARDFITIKYNGPTKSSKTRRSYVDIVYTSDGQMKNTITEKENSNDKTSVNVSQSDKTKKENVLNNNIKSTNSQNLNQSASEKIDDNYRYDTTYVNGVMKVKKIKLKK